MERHVAEKNERYTWQLYTWQLNTTSTSLTIFDVLQKLIPLTKLLRYA